MAKDKSLGMDGKPKYFMSQEKAVAFITKKKLDETHQAIDDGTGKWEILPNEKGRQSEED